MSNLTMIRWSAAASLIGSLALPGLASAREHHEHKAAAHHEIHHRYKHRGHHKHHGHVDRRGIVVPGRVREDPVATVVAPLVPLLGGITVVVR